MVKHVVLYRNICKKRGEAGRRGKRNAQRGVLEGLSLMECERLESIKITEEKRNKKTKTNPRETQTVLGTEGTNVVRRQDGRM